MFHVRARTWLADDMLGPDQQPVGGEGEEGARLGEVLLLPLPLRGMKLNTEMRSLTFRDKYDPPWPKTTTGQPSPRRRIHDRYL